MSTKPGAVPPGDLLPPIRVVSQRNSVAAATVASAYRILGERGLVIGERRRGTRVAPFSDPPLERAGIFRDDVTDLSTGNPDPALLPDLRPFLARASQPSGAYQEAVNVTELIEAARARFAADRMETPAITLTNGAMDAVERILRLYLRIGDRIAIEDPGYSSVFDVARALNLRLVPIPIDEFGVIPEAVDEAVGRHRPKAIVLTPRAHNPSGAAWDERRRREIHHVLQRHGDVLVIEDDHAGQIAGVPYFPLKLGDNRPWAVVRSVSKSLSPDLRLGIVAGPERLVGRLESSFGVGPGWVSHLIQHLVANLLLDDQVESQLAAAATVYSSRREALVEALRDRGIACVGRSGLNVWVRVPSEHRSVTGLLAMGWAVAAGERFRLQSSPSVRVTAAQLDPNDAPRFAGAMAEVLDGTRHTRST